MGKHGENIRKRKDGRWEARMIVAYNPDGKAKYRSFYGKTYIEAKEKRNQYLRNHCCQSKDETMQYETKVTVQQIMQEWLMLKKYNIKESTFAHYTNLLENHIYPKLGQIPLSLLTAEKINDFLKEELRFGRIDGKGGLSSKTVSDIL